MEEGEKEVKDESSEASAGKGRKGRKWRNLTPKQKRRAGIRGIIQFALMVWTLIDIRHRDESQIKGSKRLWTIAAFVQPIGPIAYLIFGRKR
jgi:hypothetical protein